ncbi:MAG TPA: hypothetical protein DF984_04395 [Anaerolineaceae bacterium]|jgi:hypothetical protein|nr:hypothetical protein [Anaerolineaceae bacterium]
MKKILFLIILSIFLVGCGSNKENVYCPSEISSESIDQLMLLHDAFVDYYNVAGATGRAYLAPPVLAMQEVKQEVSALTVPTCLEVAKDNLIKGMDYNVDGYLAFMKEEGNIAINEEFENGDKYLELFYDNISEILDCLPDCSKE